MSPAMVLAVSVAGEYEAWEFQGGVVLLVDLLEQYHIGLGGGGKVFQDVKFWEREALDIELKDRLSHRRMPAQERRYCRGRGGDI